MSAVIAPPSIDVPLCCGNQANDSSHGTLFHFAMNVSDLERSVRFYEILFGTPPAKHYPDYAKFELDRPPLVFSLVPNKPASPGAVSHFGFPVSTVGEVEAAGARLSAAGLQVTCQQGTVCGYARQDKIWISDPDNNYWEISVVFEHVDPETVRTGFDGVAPHSIRPAVQLAELELPVISTDNEAAAQQTAPSTKLWEHRVTHVAIERIPFDDGSLDEVRLEGSFNGELDQSQRAHLLSEARRVLKVGGLLRVHGLVSDQPLNRALPALPGMAALVKQVLTENAPVDELRAAGFENIHIEKLPESAVFRNGAVEMREIKLTATKPDENCCSEERSLIYKGPFARAVDEAGQVFERGQRTAVSVATWNALGRGAAASQFLFLGDGCGESACGT